MEIAPHLLACFLARLLVLTTMEPCLVREAHERKAVGVAVGEHLDHEVPDVLQLGVGSEARPRHNNLR